MLKLQWKMIHNYFFKCVHPRNQEWYYLEKSIHISHQIIQKNVNP